MSKLPEAAYKWLRECSDRKVSLRYLGEGAWQISLREEMAEGSRTYMYMAESGSGTTYGEGAEGVPEAWYRVHSMWEADQRPEIERCTPGCKGFKRVEPQPYTVAKYVAIENCRDCQIYQHTEEMARSLFPSALLIAVTPEARFAAPLFDGDLVAKVMEQANDEPTYVIVSEHEVTQLERQL